MSWHWTPLPADRAQAHLPIVDRIARKLALAAGDDWDALASYPGFVRARWRDVAEDLLAMIEAEQRTHH